MRCALPPFYEGVLTIGPEAYHVLNMEADAKFRMLDVSEPPRDCAAVTMLNLCGVQLRIVVDRDMAPTQFSVGPLCDLTLSPSEAV